MYRYISLNGCLDIRVLIDLARSSLDLWCINNNSFDRSRSFLARPLMYQWLLPLITDSFSDVLFATGMTLSHPIRSLHVIWKVNSKIEIKSDKIGSIGKFSSINNKYFISILPFHFSLNVWNQLIDSISIDQFIRKRSFYHEWIFHLEKKFEIINLEVNSKRQFHFHFSLVISKFNFSFLFVPFNFFFFILFYLFVRNGNNNFLLASWGRPYRILRMWASCANTNYKSIFSFSH